MAVNVLTLGQGIAAVNAAGMIGKEAMVSLLKTWAVDTAADAVSYTTGYVCDELGMSKEERIL